MYGGLEPPSKMRRTGTKADARTHIIAAGSDDPELTRPGAKGVKVVHMAGFKQRPGGPPVPRMVQLEVDWGPDGRQESYYYGLTSSRCLALLRGLNPAMSFAVSRQRSQYSTMNGGCFLRILTDMDGKVVSFARR